MNTENINNNNIEMPKASEYLADVAAHCGNIDKSKTICVVKIGQRFMTYLKYVYHGSRRGAKEYFTRMLDATVQGRPERRDYDHLLLYAMKDNHNGEDFFMCIYDEQDAETTRNWLARKKAMQIAFPDTPLLLPAPVKKNKEHRPIKKLAPSPRNKKTPTKHSKRIKEVLSIIPRSDKKYYNQHGINLASPKLRIIPSENKKSTDRVMRETRETIKEGWSFILVALYKSRWSNNDHYDATYAEPDGEKWTAECSKATFEECRRQADTKMFIIMSPTLEKTEKTEIPEEYKRDRYNPGRYGHDKSGYEKPQMNKRLAEAHNYFSRKRRQEAEAAFNPDDREKTLSEAKRTLTETRMKIAEYIIENDYVPTIDFWSIGWALRHIENAETDDELKQGIDEFNKELTKINNLLTPIAA